MSKKKKAYCRGCNRTFTIDSELPDSYVEVLEKNKARHLHPKVDCDLIGERHA
jgi:hypothetical protein